MVGLDALGKGRKTVVTYIKFIPVFLLLQVNLLETIVTVLDVVRTVIWTRRTAVLTLSQWKTWQ